MRKENVILFFMGFLETDDGPLMSVEGFRVCCTCMQQLCMQLIDSLRPDLQHALVTAMPIWRKVKWSKLKHERLDVLLNHKENHEVSQILDCLDDDLQHFTSTIAAVRMHTAHSVLRILCWIVHI